MLGMEKWDLRMERDDYECGSGWNYPYGACCNSFSALQMSQK